MTHQILAWMTGMLHCHQKGFQKLDHAISKTCFCVDAHLKTLITVMESLCMLGITQKSWRTKRSLPVKYQTSWRKWTICFTQFSDSNSYWFVPGPRFLCYGWKQTKEHTPILTFRVSCLSRGGFNNTWLIKLLTATWFQYLCMWSSKCLNFSKQA